MPPPFFYMMVDIAFRFKGQPIKKSRTVLKFYAFVGVCILTGATSILVLEGLQTQDLILALERHSSRHGIPSEVFVDNETQLMALKDVNFSIRNVDAEVYRSMGIWVHDKLQRAMWSEDELNIKSDPPERCWRGQELKPQIP